MSESDHCADCQRPVRLVRVSGWKNGPKDGTLIIPLDYIKSVEGDYTVIGPETAFFVQTEDRPKYLRDGTPLYTDHRRTCPMAKNESDPDRPLFSKLRIECGACQERKQFWSESNAARSGVEKFIEEHLNCRGRKAS